MYISVAVFVKNSRSNVRDLRSKIENKKAPFFTLKKGANHKVDY